MTASRHHAHAARSCHAQAQQRCAVTTPVVASGEDRTAQQVFAGTMGNGRPVMFSVWIKKTGAGNQN